MSIYVPCPSAVHSSGFGHPPTDLSALISGQVISRPFWSPPEKASWQPVAHFGR
jgi:hypothetical protein